MELSYSIGHVELYLAWSGSGMAICCELQEKCFNLIGISYLIALNLLYLDTLVGHVVGKRLLYSKKFVIPWVLGCQNLARLRVTAY